jgi:peptidoglycan-N-acetylglucosamine deacetylase
MFIRASAAVHVAAIGLTAARPALWPWAASALLTNHAIATASGLWPRSSWLGANWTQLPAAAGAASKVAITLDDGPDQEVTPQVLDILDRHQAVATFFCIGERIAALPSLAREIVRRGHCVENHSQRHAHHFSLMGPGSMLKELSRAQDTIREVTGLAPVFFRAPAGLRNPFLDPVLSRLGLTLASWTRRGFDTVARQPSSVLARLTQDLRGGDILLLHDGHAARTASGSPVVLAVLPALLEQIRQLQLVTTTLRSVL